MQHGTMHLYLLQVLEWLPLAVLALELPITVVAALTNSSMATQGQWPLL